MLTINNITPLPNQRLTYTLENKQTFTLHLKFLPTQEIWQGEIIYGTIPNIRFSVVNTVNLLRQFANLLPFGLMCYSDDGTSPFQITDFSSINGLPPRCVLYILNQDDIASFNQIAYGQTAN